MLTSHSDDAQRLYSVSRGKKLPGAGWWQRSEWIRAVKFAGLDQKDKLRLHCVHFSHQVWSSDLETGGFGVFLFVALRPPPGFSHFSCCQSACTPAACTLIKVLMHIKPSSSVRSFGWCDTSTEACFCLCEQIPSLSVSQVEPLSESSAVAVSVPGSSRELNSSLGVLMAEPGHVVSTSDWEHCTAPGEYVGHWSMTACTAS